MKKYYYPKISSAGIDILPKNPLIDIKQQSYKSIVHIAALEAGYKKELSNSSKKRITIPKGIFQSSIFSGTEFNDIYKAKKKFNILAKNPRLVIRLNKRLSYDTAINCSTRYLGVAYSGMNFGSSYLGNTIGIPLIKENKIITPDRQFEKEVLDHCTFRNKNIYTPNIKNIFKLMKEFRCKVYYQGNINTIINYKFFHIKDYIQDNYYKSIFEKIITSYRTNKEKEFLIVNEYIVDTKDITKYLSEIMDILIGEDLKKFKKHQMVARAVSKTEVLSNLDTLLKGFRITPFEHQKTGISWLYKLYKGNLPGAILADDVGVGKTAQAIGLCTILLNEKQLTSGKFKDIIIVCPASVISVWEKEIASFNPNLLKRCTIYSFEMFTRVTISNKPVLLIVDEAQRAKNKNTINNKRLITVKAKFTLLLSGTPIENKTQDLYNILSIVDPVFGKIYNTLARVSKDESVIAGQTRKIIDGIYLRRLKTKEQLTAVLNIEEIRIKMSKQEEEAHKNILDFYGNKKVKMKATKSIEYYNEFIIALGRLRQAVSYVKQLQDQPYIKNKAMTPTSSKGARLLQLIKSKKDEKFIIFSSFKESIKYLKTILEPNGKVLIIDGSVPSSRRGDIISKFQTDPDYKYIIVSLKAGNSGITLHSANNVVIYDLWWNPAILHQAIARAYRIGQVKDTTAYLFINEKSIDENIINIINIKKEILNAFENTSATKNEPNINKLIDTVF